MDNTLLNYMNKRFNELEKKQVRGEKEAGPVITISRDVGCGGLKISKALAEELNKCVFCKQWQVVSKEVLNESAQELKIAPEKVSRLLTSNEHFTFEEILSAFTDKYYKSNKVILKTVKDVIRNFAIDGCCIILGRAGHIIAADVENAVHIRLTAPLAWRVESISASRNLSKADALKYIQETGKERDLFRNYFVKGKGQEDNFDLVINVSRFTTGQVVNLIKTAFDIKGITEKMKKKVPFF